MEQGGEGGGARELSPGQPRAPRPTRARAPAPPPTLDVLYMRQASQPSHTLADRSRMPQRSRRVEMSQNLSVVNAFMSWNARDRSSM